MWSFRIRSRLNVPPTSSQIMSEYSIHRALGRLRNRPGETRLSGIFFTLHRETFARLIARKHFDSSRLFPLALFVSLVDAWRDFHISCLMFYIHYTHYTLFSYTSFCHLRPQIAKARRGGRRGKVTAVITDNIVK